MGIAKDPRDIIFAILDLAHEEAVGISTVDYTLATTGVYQQVTIHTLTSEQNLNFLYLVMTPSRDTGTPSWCVDHKSDKWS